MIKQIHENIQIWIAELLSDAVGQKIETFIEKNYWIIKSESVSKSLKVGPINRDFYKPDSLAHYQLLLWDQSGSNDLLLPDGKLPVFLERKCSEPMISECANFITINFDFLGMCFWVMNRLEEYDHKCDQNHGRFPLKKSHAYKNNYYRRPIADEWFYFLRKNIFKNTEQNDSIKPNRAVRLSCDVDRPLRYALRKGFTLYRSVVIDMIKTGSILPLKAAVSSRYSKGLEGNKLDPYNTFEQLMDIADKIKQKIQFNFISISRNKYDGIGYLEYQFFLELLERITQRNHKVGFHGSYDGIFETILLKSEVQKLREKILEISPSSGLVSARSHFLRGDVPNFLWRYHQSGINEDSTLGWAESYGFRCGTSRPYKLFDVNRNCVIPVLELPLICMDRTIFHKGYLGGQGLDQSIEEVRRLKEICHKADGHFSLLWHNCNLMTKRQDYTLAAILD